MRIWTFAGSQPHKQPHNISLSSRSLSSAHLSVCLLFAFVCKPAKSINYLLTNLPTFLPQPDQLHEGREVATDLDPFITPLPPQTSPHILFSNLREKCLEWPKYRAPVPVPGQRPARRIHRINPLSSKSTDLHRAQSVASAPQQPPWYSPLHRIPLNDDAQEKKGRLHSRKALHEKQINELQAAAATPKKSLIKANENASPRSNQGATPLRAGDDDDEGFTVTGSGVTPMKRVPILANFEEWMKMATDNKINANNSWNFALIDYFHDMSLLKEGDGVNFQRASCTLDGCVKIYTSRVDSVATETGKLLSGLADSNSKKKDKENEDGEDSEEEVDEEGNVIKKKSKKRVSRDASGVA